MLIFYMIKSITLLMSSKLASMVLCLAMQYKYSIYYNLGHIVYLTLRHISYANNDIFILRFVCVQLHCME